MAVQTIGSGSYSLPHKQKSRLFAYNWVECVIYGVVKYGSLCPFRTHESANSCGTQYKGRTAPSGHQPGGARTSCRREPHILGPPRELQVFSHARSARKNCEGPQDRSQQSRFAALDLRETQHVPKLRWQTKGISHFSSNWRSFSWNKAKQSSLVIDVLIRLALPARNHFPRIPFIKPSNKLSTVLIEYPLYGPRLCTLLAHLQIWRVLGFSFLLSAYLDARGRRQLKPNGCRHSSAPQLMPGCFSSTGDIRRNSTSRSGCSYKYCKCTIKNAKGRKTTQIALVVH